MARPDKKIKKIDKVIRDTQLKFDHVDREIMLLIREKETLAKFLNTLDIIKESEEYA